MRGREEIDELLTPQEVADILKVTVQAVYQMKHRGILPAVDFGLRSVRFRRNDVAKLLKKKEVTV